MSTVNKAPSAIQKGFLLTRQWQESDQGQTLTFWIICDDGPRQIHFDAQESVFFICASDLPLVKSRLDGIVQWRYAEVALKSFTHESIVACYFPDQKQLVQARARLPHMIVLEGDIRPTDRFLMERFITAGVEIESDQGDGLSVIRNPRIRPAEYQPDLSIVSLDIETSYTEHILYSVALHFQSAGHQEDCVFMVAEQFDSDEEAPSDLHYLHYLPSERAVIEAMLDWFAQRDPDVIIGWSVVGFDLNFLQQRCDALDLPFELGRQRSLVRWRNVTTGRAERKYALVPGRVVLDGIEVLRSATYQFESFSLEFVANALLGRGKLIDDVDARASKIQQLYREDKPKLAAYNLEDCVLVADIFRHTQLIQFSIERARLTGLEMDRPGGSVAAFDYLYLPRLHRQGFVAPVVAEDARGGGPGGFVLNSQPGIYQHVLVLDFKSLYPSIIRTFHVDPLAMVVGETEEDGIEGFLGAVFSRETSLLPAIIENLWQARDLAKQKGDKVMSQAIKIIMNSFYGVLGTPGCRFFDPRLVSSITLRGHQILQTTRDLIEQQGLKVIYGDTDSVFVHVARGGSGRDIHQDIDRDIDQEIDEVGSRLAAHLNDWWTRHLQSEFGVESCLEVEFETHYHQFFMPTVRGSEEGSKKRYAGMIQTDKGHELVFKGLESVRSDWSQLARDFQKELYRRIFFGEPYEDYIKQTVASVLAGELDDILVLRKRLRRRLAEYEKNVPPHVKAARLADEIRESRGLEPLYGSGGWIEYVMTITGAEPRAYVCTRLDYQFYIDKQLAPIADAILNFKNASLASITDRQMGLF